MKAPAFQTEAQKTFCQTFQKLCSHTSAWQVWSDFVQLTAIALSNRCDMQAKREKQYNEIMQQYDRAEQSVFAELFSQMVTALEEQPEQDFLGDMFMRLELGSHWHGQFFTPYSVCRLLSSVTIRSAVEQVAEHGYCKVNDCACGAGATLIAARNSLQTHGHRNGSGVVRRAGRRPHGGADVLHSTQSAWLCRLCGDCGYTVKPGSGKNHSAPKSRAGHLVHAGIVFVRCLV